MKAPDPTVKKLIAMPRELMEAIGEFRFQERIKSEAEAIRTLIQRGLASANKVLALQKAARKTKVIPERTPLRRQLPSDRW
jgi:hypothetical protein